MLLKGLRLTVRVNAEVFQPITVCIVIMFESSMPHRSQTYDVRSVMISEAVGLGTGDMIDHVKV